MPTIAQQCATEAARPILRRSISGIRRALGMQRNIAKKIESLRPELRALTDVVEPVIQADARAGAFRARAHKELDAIFRRFGMTETEGVLAHALGGPAASAFYPDPKQAEAGSRFLEWMVKQLGEVGMDRTTALRFLQRDIVALRQHKGDLSRLDPNNLRPITFQPFARDIREGFFDPTTNNGYMFGRQLASLISRAKFVHPEIERANKLIFSDWERLRKTLPGKDIKFAQDFAENFLDGRISRHDELLTQTASLIRGLIDQLGDAWGAGKAARRVSGSKYLDDETIVRMVDNSLAWFGGYAMGFNPAMVFRDLVGGTLLPATKVGPEAAWKGIRDVWARGEVGEATRRRIANYLGLPGDLSQPLAEQAVGENVILLSRAGRLLDEGREFGLLPRRWSDKMSRLSAARQGEVAIELHAPRLLRGETTWEDFLYETGLKGSSLAEQEKIRQILVGRQIPNVQEAAEVYGRMVMQDSNFVYSAANAPLAFRGTVGRLFGQFGIWPVSFAEYVLENTVGARDAKWATRFATRFAALQVAFAGLSLATGIDTSTWMFSNPLTFQGGPWYQAFRDVTTLGTSTNEFERREASANVRKMFGNSTTGFMGGILNPFGGATTNLFQATAEDNPIDALLLGLGFNLERPELATRRR